MGGVITWEHKVTSSFPPAKLFKALFLDGDNLIPKILPQAMKSVEILQGDGGAGTIKLIHFGEGCTLKSMKHHVDEVDMENFVYKYSVIEGDVLGDMIEKIAYEVKILPSAHGGSIIKSIRTGYTKGDSKNTEENTEMASAIFKALEAHLIANPDSY